MKVAMVGAGYVGLVSSACFAEFGADVTCIDIDSDKIGKLREGVVPIYEPGLAELINKNREQGRLVFRDGYDESIAECDLVFIAVGTPARRGDGHADLKYVYQAARDIAPYLEGYTVIVDKSTVPVGTAREPSSESSQRVKSGSCNLTLPPIPSFCGKAPHWLISCDRTGWSSALKQSGRKRRCGSCIGLSISSKRLCWLPTWKAPS